MPRNNFLDGIIKLGSPDIDIHRGSNFFEFGKKGRDELLERVQGMEGYYNWKHRKAFWFWNQSLGENSTYRFNGVIGKQKDYFLQGNKGESFITVLSGTEKVFRNFEGGATV